MKRFIQFIIIAFIISACSASETPEPTATSTEIIPSETAVRATKTPIPPVPTATSTSTLTETPEPTKNTSTSSTDFSNYPEEGYGPLNFPEDINPLTGLEVDDVSLLERRPVAVKISMEPRGTRPQWGLSFADHVYEYYQEGGLIDGRTRLFAVFYGQNTEMAGPIRSARFADEDLVRMYKAVFGFGSADYRVLYRLNYSEFYNRLASVSDYPCPPTPTYPLCRTEPEGWNHLVTDTEMLSQHFTEAGIDNSRQNLNGLAFNPILPEEGEEADTVTLRYTAKIYSKWEYDSRAGNYVRYQDVETDFGEGEVYDILIDRVNDQPITTENVVVLLVDQQYYLVTPEMIEFDLMGYGDAYLFRDGMVYELNWARTADAELIAITYDDGSRFPLKPGSTWFQVMTTNSSIESDDGAWRFTYDLPES